MKRILIGLLSVLLLVCVVSCKDEPPVHEHDYGELVPQVDATCTTAGLKAHYHCEGCNKNFDVDYNELTYIVIPALGMTMAN